MASDSSKISTIVRNLAGQYGSLLWWPGSADDVMIGAILTQQTRWENVEDALARLREAGICSIAAINDAPEEQVEDLIRCTGFFRVKTRRLKDLAAHVIATYGGTAGMRGVPTDELRRGLLGVKGIGEETADSILCYGFGRATFVVDAYTERICRCAGVATPRRNLKDLFESVLPARHEAYAQGHAHIVEYAKEYCGRGRCDECWIRSLNGSENASSGRGSSGRTSGT